MLQGTITSAKTADTAGGEERDRVVGAGSAVQSSLPSSLNMSSPLWIYQ